MLFIVCKKLVLTQCSLFIVLDSILTGLGGPQGTGVQEAGQHREGVSPACLRERTQAASHHHFYWDHTEIVECGTQGDPKAKVKKTHGVCYFFLPSVENNEEIRNA